MQLKERGSSHFKRVYVTWVSSREVNILCSWCRMYSLVSRMCSLGVHASMFIRTSSDNIAVCVCVCVCVVVFVRVCLRVCPCACCARACLSIGGFQGRGFRFTVAKHWCRWAHQRQAIDQSQTVKCVDEQNGVLAGSVGLFRHCSRANWRLRKVRWLVL